MLPNNNFTSPLLQLMTVLTIARNGYPTMDGTYKHALVLGAVSITMNWQQNKIYWYEQAWPQPLLSGALQFCLLTVIWVVWDWVPIVKVGCKWYMKKDLG